MSYFQMILFAISEISSSSFLAVNKINNFLVCDFLIKQPVSKRITLRLQTRSRRMCRTVQTVCLLIKTLLKIRFIKSAKWKLTRSEERRVGKERRSRG